ncbi:MAG: hypothetical protein IKD42_01845, partial [Kiritimatiellae bacterium]|nr:hypothetical protein [Kiritimatiellia bacterium]
VSLCNLLRCAAKRAGFKAAFAASLMALGAFSDALAAEVTWTGGEGGDLLDPENWSTKSVPGASDDCIISNPASAIKTFTLNGSFTPKTITFPSGSAKVRINGTGSISGVSSIINNTAHHHIFNVPVTCSGATPTISHLSKDYMTFSGGLTLQNLPKTGSKTEDYWCGKITVTSSSVQTYGTGGNYGILTGAGSTLRAPKAIFDHFKFNAGTTGIVEIVNESSCRRNWGYGSSKGWCSFVFDSQHGVLKAGEIKTTGDTILFHSYGGSDNGYYGGTIEAKKLTCATTKNTGGEYNQARFFLNCGQLYDYFVASQSTGEGIWAIGSGGLSFGTGITDESNYRIQLGGAQDGRPGATLYSYEDWALAAHPNGAAKTALFLNKSNNGTSYPNTLLVIDTSHYKTGDATLDEATKHTVTLNGRIEGDGVMGVKGSGTVVFANTSNVFSGGLWASNSVRVVVNSGCKPGTGYVKLNNSSTLELKSGASVGGALTLGGSRRVILPEAGTATISGKASFWTDSAACFHVDGTANAKLVFGKTPEFQKNITIYLTEDSDPLVGRSYTLTQGAGLTALSTDTTSFKLADGTPGTLSIVGGELVYNAPKYFYITVR